MSATTLVDENGENEPHDHLKNISDTDKKELIESDSRSIISDTTLNETDNSLKAAKSLTIVAKGISAIRLPTPSSEMTIDIYNPDGTVAYRSSRATRKSGNSVLSDSQGRPLLATEYFFGPSRDPVIHILDENGIGSADIKTVSRWTSRSHMFLLPDGRKLTWQYKKQKFAGAEQKVTSLVLTCNEKCMAILRRDNETRTLGTKRCTAGNGGELLLAEDVSSKEGVNEELVVATCLLMLKKEVDRRRAVQCMVIASVVSS